MDVGAWIWVGLHARATQQHDTACTHTSSMDCWGAGYKFADCNGSWLIVFDSWVLCSQLVLCKQPSGLSGSRG